MLGLTVLQCDHKKNKHPGQVLIRHAGHEIMRRVLVQAPDKHPRQMPTPQFLQWIIRWVLAGSFLGFKILKYILFFNRATSYKHPPSEYV